MNADHYNAFCYNTLRVGLDPPPLQQETDHEGGSTMQPEYDVRPDQDVLFAWREGLAEAGPSQDMKQQLLQREGELLPRFAAHYDDLTHLPRSMRRRLQRHWKRSLAGVALLLVLGQTSAMAATINVGGVCTLVRAINAANNDTTATGHCKKGSGADLIVMPRNSTVTLTTVNDTTFGPTGLPTVRGVVTIDGNGSTVRRSSGAPKFRIFAVAESAKLTLQSTRISGGRAVTVPGMYVSGGGGGLLNYAGDLTLTNCTVSGNGAKTSGGGVENVGGGRFDTRDGTLTVINSTISGNTAHDGGGVYNSGVHNGYEGSVTLMNSTVSGNRAVRRGGGVGNVNYAGAGITNSTISGNTAGGSGGGLFNYYAASSLTNSTVSGNKAHDGGGVYNGYDNTIVTFTNSTVSNNIATTNGGGIYTGDRVFLHRALISGNVASAGQEVFHSREGSGGTAADFNVFGRKGLTNAQAFVGFAPSGTDITATSNGNRPTALNRILNTMLANNGGRTRTHALVAGSPAVDAVNDGTCPPPARDQRGFKRPRDGNGDGGPACDVGAFER